MPVKLNFSLEQDLSSIGDSLANFIYSLALSNAYGKPVGKKLSNRVLAQALKEAGLREKAGTRVSFHRMGNFAEHYIFRGWAEGLVSIEEGVEIVQGLLEQGEVRAIAGLLEKISSRRE